VSETISKYRKLRLGVYFKGTSCACGAEKGRCEWSCKACKEALRDTRQGRELKAACNAHLTAADVIIGLCRQRGLA